ncbi:hypothetical protein TWF730_004054 [Orbilia blumenaviensis]|uniref:PHD-type domain-containing protein n=1 Tax=Orbilia blumenaviensis TaxID=1796055 RepID=A0AAV9U258_9PEZI
MAAVAPMSRPIIKLHFSAGTNNPTPPLPLPAELEEEEAVVEDERESEEPESSGNDGDYDDVESLKEYSKQPGADTAGRHRRMNDSTVDIDRSISNTGPAPVAPFRPIRIILKAPKRNPEDTEEMAATASPVRKKRKRRRSKTSLRRYDSSTSSEEYIQSGFRTLSGRTIINPNTRKEQPQSPPSHPQSPLKASKPHAKPQVSRSYSKPKSPPSPSPTAAKHLDWSPISPRTTRGGRTFMDPIQEAIRRSIIEAQCVSCRKAADSRGDKIVFCDGCERAYHQKCHLPNIDQSYIEVVEKNWYCSQCPQGGGDEQEKKEDEEGEKGRESEEDAEIERKKEGVIKEPGSHQDESRRAEEAGDNRFCPAEEEEQTKRSQPTNNLPHSAVINTAPAESQDMEESVKQLSDEQHKLFLKTLTHSDLADLVCRLRENGAAYNFTFPAGMKNKLSNFIHAQKEKNKEKKRKHSELSEKTELEAGQAIDDEEGEGEDSEDETPELKHPKLTPSQRYWLWREDPQSPAITHLVYRNGVGRPAHEVYPPLHPFPGKKQQDPPNPDRRDGEET